MSRMSKTSRSVRWRRMVQASANMAVLPVRDADLGIVCGGGAQDRFGRANGPGHGPDVVDPEDVGAALGRQDGRRDRALEPLAGRQVEDGARKALREKPRRSGRPRAWKSALAAEELEVVLDGLAEAEAGIDDDALRRDAGGPGDADAGRRGTRRSRRGGRRNEGRSAS